MIFGSCHFLFRQFTQREILPAFKVGNGGEENKWVTLYNCLGRKYRTIYRREGSGARKAMNAKLLGLFSGFPTHHFTDEIALVLRENLPRRESLAFISAWPEDYARNNDDSDGMHEMFAECGMAFAGTGVLQIILPCMLCQPDALDIGHTGEGRAQHGVVFELVLSQTVLSQVFLKQRFDLVLRTGILTVIVPETLISVPVRIAPDQLVLFKYRPLGLPIKLHTPDRCDIGAAPVEI